MARIVFNFLAGGCVMSFLLGFLFFVNGRKAKG